MAVVVASITAFEFTSHMLHLYGTLTPSGSYATGGDTLAWTGNDAIKSDQIPVQVEIFSGRLTTSAQTNLFVYQYTPGTTKDNGKMQVFTGAAAQTALTELSAGAYPAGVTADVVSFHATFPKNI